MRSIALLTIIFANLCVGSSTRVPAAEQLNVLFLVADDLNCDLHCYGNRQVNTPNIDRLAARGVQFQNAYCQFPLCSPSRTSFLTGRRPNATMIRSNPRAGRFSTDYTATPHFREYIPDTVTMPQLFRNNGYVAARIGKLYHYGVPGQIGTSGLDDAPSWDFVVNPAGRDKAEEAKVFTLKAGSYGGTLSWLATEGSSLEHTDGLSATAAISLLNLYRDKPFFLACGFYRPHTPYVAPKNFFELYPTTKIELPKLSNDDVSRKPTPAYASSNKEAEDMSDDLRREAIQAYWASITFMDEQVGRVLDELDRLGLAEKTIVVMTSDHGYHLYHHGLWQKQSLFENSARVPLLISVPGGKQAGATTQSLVELVDLYPTLAELCGLKAPDYLDGKSLTPILKDSRAKVKEAAYTQVRRGNFSGYSVRTNRYRFTAWDNGEKGEQLYDMLADPNEMNNLALNPNAETAQALEAHRKLIQTYAATEIAEAAIAK